MPRDLSIGLLIERFNSPPWEFGYGTQHDVALMHRALYALWVYRTAQQSYNKDQITHLTRDQLELIEHVRTLTSKSQSKAVRRRVFKRQRRAHL